MPALRVWIAPPDQWEEVFSSDGNSNSHRISVDGKIAPFRTKILPEQAGSDAIRVDLISTSTSRAPEIGSDRLNGTYASIPVDFAALGWAKDQWAKGQRVDITLFGEAADGFTLGISPDGDDLVWDQKRAQYLQLNSVTMSVSAYKDSSEIQAAEAPIPQPPIHPELQKALARIIGKLNVLVWIVAIATVYYWVHK